MHPAWKTALAAVMLGLLLPTAVGQALDPAVGVQADAERVVVPFDGARVVTWTVRNDGPVQATVALDLSLDGPWSSDFGDRYAGPFTLPSGGVRTLSVRVAPTTDTTEALPDGAATLAATATDGAGRTATGSAAVALGYGPAPPPPPPPPADHTLRNGLLGAGAALFLLAGLHAGLGRTVVFRHAADTVHLGSLRGAWMRMEVANRAPWAQVVHVRLRSGPGVVATTDADRIHVGPRDRAQLSLFVRSAGDDGRIVLEARTRGHRWRRQACLRVAHAPPEPSPFVAPAVAQPVRPEL